MKDEDIIFDFSKVKGKIKELFGTQANFADKMNIDEVTLSNKLNNKTEFSSKEIIKACNLLNISSENLNDYFFALQVQKT